MARPIDADELLQKMQQYLKEPVKEWDKMSLREKAIALDFMGIVRNMPTVEQKHGHWELINNDYIACGLCGEKLTKNRFTPYCDNCGASMTKGKSLILGAKMDEVENVSNNT